MNPVLRESHFKHSIPLFLTTGGAILSPSRLQVALFSNEGEGWGLKKELVSVRIANSFTNSLLSLGQMLFANKPKSVHSQHKIR